MLVTLNATETTANTNRKQARKLLTEDANMHDVIIVVGVPRSVVEQSKNFCQK